MHENLDTGHLHVAVDLMILTVQEGEMMLLLSRRNRPPFKGCWSLPGRMLGMEESAEASVERLLSEMLLAKPPYMEQLYTFTALNRDPRGRAISIAYLILLPWNRAQEVLGREDLTLCRFRVRLEGEKLQLISPEGFTLSSGDLAFDHGAIVSMGVTRLRGKIDYTDLSFHFLKDTESFSLSELKTIFQAVLDTPIDASNFRRSIRGSYEAKGIIEPIDYEKPQGRGRPSLLYRLVKAQ